MFCVLWHTLQSVSNTYIALRRFSGAHISAAAKDEAGQKSLCGGVCDWPGATDSRPPYGLRGGARSRFEDRDVQPQATRLRLLRPQQRPLVPGQHREEPWIHAARLGSGQDLRYVSLKQNVKIFFLFSKTLAS